MGQHRFMAGQPRHITAAEGVHGWGEQYYHHRAHIRKLDNVPDFPQLGGGGGFVVVVVCGGGCYFDNASNYGYGWMVSVGER